MTVRRVPSRRANEVSPYAPERSVNKPDEFILRGGRELTYADYQQLSELERIKLAVIDRRAKDAADLERFAQKRTSIVTFYGTEQADEYIQVKNRMLEEIEAELTRDDPTQSPVLRGLIGLMPVTR